MLQRRPHVSDSELDDPPEIVQRNSLRSVGFPKGSSPAQPHATNTVAASTSAQTDVPESPQAFETGEFATLSPFPDWQHPDNADGLVYHQAYGPITNGERVGSFFTGTNYGTVNQTFEEHNVLRDLPIHPDISGYLSDYFPGSRTDDETQILQWIDSNHGPSELVLCVLGKVGVGKSTLARHLATRLDKDKRLAANIFLGFALPDCTAESAVRIIAGQLCGTYPTLTRAIHEAIRLDLNPSLTLETRIQLFILEPIRSLHLPHPLVVLLDAVDQWAPHPILIRALACLVAEAHLIRFVVFGRPGFEDYFRDVTIRRYDLPDVSDSVMGKYFMVRFDQVQWEYRRKPSAQTINQLVNKARGLFVWSSTLCSLLEDRMSCPNPYETLTAILQSQQSIGDNDILANLYHGAINLRFPKPEHKTTLTVFLRGVLVLQQPLPVTAFASLVSMAASTIREIVACLRPLQTGQTKEPLDMVYPALLMFHFSVLEWLQSSHAHSHLALPIDIFTSHFQLGKYCLEELRRLLSSPDSAFITPLQQYAMRYWPIHTAHGTPNVSPTSDAEWRATPHFAILDSLTVLQWQHWASAYLQAIRPGAAPDLTIKVFTIPPPLYPTEERRSTVRTTLRGLWRKLSHEDEAPSAPTHYTPQYIICCITRSLVNVLLTASIADAIALAEVAVRLQHQSSNAWLKLGTAYGRAAQTDLSRSLIESAVQACRYASDIRGEGDRLVHRILANCLYERFNRLGLREDLDEATSLERAVLLLTPPGHPNRAMALNNLASSLQSQYISTGTSEHLGEAIALHREALSLRPSGHPKRAVALNNLASCLYSHFKLTGAAESLDEAVVLFQEALRLRPPGSSQRAVALNNLANCLQSHFEQTGTAGSVNEAIALHREALSLWPSGHPDRAMALNNLAISLKSSFELTGTTESLEEAITLYREAFSLRPSGHPHRALSLNNLAHSLQSHFEQTGASESLEEATVLFREALSLRPPDHHKRSASLNNLANALNASYILTGNTQALDEAKSLLLQATKTAR